MWPRFLGNRGELFQGKTRRKKRVQLWKGFEVSELFLASATLEVNQALHTISAAIVAKGYLSPQLI